VIEKIRYTDKYKDSLRLEIKVLFKLLG